MNLISILISLLSGAVGGNLAGKVFKNLDLGTIGNSLAGIAGGGVGALILNLLGIGASADASTNSSSIIGGIASGGVGGAILMAIVSAIKNQSLAHEECRWFFFAESADKKFFDGDLRSLHLFCMPLTQRKQTPI
jgi:uncharacterized membrane protein YeaQ/YmgE (transglycosylase-associated protein family)